MTDETKQTTRVEVEQPPPETEAKLVWASGRVLFALALCALIIWWRLRNGGELSEAIDESLNIFNNLAMGGSLLMVIGMIARTWKGSKKLTVDPKKTVPVVQPPKVTLTSETTTTTTTDGGTP